MGSCATDTWFFSAWEDRCSEECGDGVQRRRVHCSGDALDNQVMETSCDSEQRPATTRACTSDRGCGGKWFTGAASLGTQAPSYITLITELLIHLPTFSVDFSHQDLTCLF